jgi:hypothetical protein
MRPAKAVGLHSMMCTYEWNERRTLFSAPCDCSNGFRHFQVFDRRVTSTVSLASKGRISFDR